MFNFLGKTISLLWINTRKSGGLFWGKACGVLFIFIYLWKTIGLFTQFSKLVSQVFLMCFSFIDSVFHRFSPQSTSPITTTICFKKEIYNGS